MTNKRTSLFGPVMTWTILTTVFTWLPLVRIIGRPVGYHWVIPGFSGTGTTGPFWIFIPLLLYAVTLLFSAYRGPRALFYPMLLLWHLALTAVVLTGAWRGGPGAVWQGQGLRFSFPLWLLAVPFTLFTGLAILWVVNDYRSGAARPRTPWTRTNSVRLALSLLLLVVGLLLFRAGTNYNWVTATAIITTILHWILLAESFQPAPPTARAA